jgi:hypothetical protein
MAGEYIWRSSSNVFRRQPTEEAKEEKRAVIMVRRSPSRTMCTACWRQGHLTPEGGATSAAVVAPSLGPLRGQRLSRVDAKAPDGKPDDWC